MKDTDDFIDSEAALAALYGMPMATATVKEKDHLIPAYSRYIETAPFMALATVGPEGLDCSPRGDQDQVVHIADTKTLLMPDRRGNNRIDSLRNIVRDPRVALLFLIPGSGTTLRVNGRARLCVTPSLLARFAVGSALPRCVLMITVERAYFQCARAIMRSKLWSPDDWPDITDLPTPGDMLAQASQGQEGGQAYDATWQDRAQKSLW